MIPDPLLLHRISNVFIYPVGMSDFSVPIGTGAYRLKELRSSELVMERFSDYWGLAPFFEEANFVYLPDFSDRMTAFSSGEVDFLANVPPQFIEGLKEQDLPLYDFPSLELSFLTFNLDGVLKDETLREAASLALSTDYAEKLGGDYLRASDQYAATGILGYHTDLPVREQDLVSAYRLLEEESPELFVVLPQGLQSLGALIEADLSAVGFDLSIDYLDPEDYYSVLEMGEVDITFEAWHYDLPDLADFFEGVVRGQGFEEVEALMDLASVELNLEQRRAL